VNKSPPRFDRCLRAFFSPPGGCKGSVNLIRVTNIYISISPPRATTRPVATLQPQLSDLELRQVSAWRAHLMRQTSRTATLPFQSIFLVHGSYSVPDRQTDRLRRELPFSYPSRRLCDDLGPTQAAPKCHPRRFLTCCGRSE